MTSGRGAIVFEVSVAHEEAEGQFEKVPLHPTHPTSRRLARHINDEPATSGRRLRRVQAPPSREAVFLQGPVWVALLQWRQDSNREWISQVAKLLRFLSLSDFLPLRIVQ